ncbi:isochorismate synthase [Flavobacterium haoranii]|uniref:isochorismate synthase n=1 Tax=Flavobacterium haoranii TaxID=683124 RepID=A0A1M6LUV6_9FLAO|nr:isochorismate synthase [Flavobacterium haoranii]SHJ75028.1 isochorismate synthase [Flavobacterium haoranii]
MTELFSKLYSQLEQNLPFVIYSKPNDHVSNGLFQQNDTLHELESENSSGFVFASFYNDVNYIIPIAESELISVENTIKEVQYNEFEQSFTQEAKTDFENLVSLFVKEIRSGSCSKIVASRCEKFELKDFDVEKSFKRMVYLYPTAFKYCFFHPEIGMWLGATPEQLLKVNNNEISTVALAGTKTINELEKEWGEKEKIEQQLVTNFISESLEPFVDKLTLSEPYTYQAGKLLHIKTDIKAILKDNNHKDKVVQVLHPTPAVCGFPKDYARDFIIKNEGYARDFYAGFLGEWNFKINEKHTTDTDLFVNLRCCKIEDQVAKIFIGCGITEDSNPELEFIETVNKSETIKKIL